MGILVLLPAVGSSVFHFSHSCMCKSAAKKCSGFVDNRCVTSAAQAAAKLTELILYKHILIFWNRTSICDWNLKIPSIITSLSKPNLVIVYCAANNKMYIPETFFYIDTRALSLCDWTAQDEDVAFHMIRRQRHFLWRHRRFQQRHAHDVDDAIVNFNDVSIVVTLNIVHVGN